MISNPYCFEGSKFDCHNITFTSWAMVGVDANQSPIFAEKWIWCYLCTTSPLYYQCETEAARKVGVDKWHMGWFLSLWSSLLRDCAGLRLAWQGQCPWPYGSSTLFGNEDGPEQNLKEWARGSSPTPSPLCCFSKMRIFMYTHPT